MERGHWFGIWVIVLFSSWSYRSTIAAEVDPQTSIINVRATLYEVPKQDLEKLSQEKLRRIVDSVLVKDSDPAVDFAVSVDSGTEAEVKQVRELWLPDQFGGNEVIHAKVDTAKYSIPSEPHHAPEIGETYIIPGHALSFSEKEAGHVFRVKPTVYQDGSIHLEGSVSETWISGVKEKFPKVTAVRKALGKKTTELAPAMELPVLQTKQQAFKTSRSRKVKYYLPFPVTKGSVAADSAEEFSFRNLIRKSGHSGILVIEAEQDKMTLAMRSEEKDDREKQIYITTKFIEANHPLPTLTYTDPQFQYLVRQENQKRGTDLLSAPSLMVRPEKDKGHIEVGKDFIFPRAYDAVETDFSKIDAGTFPVTPATPKEFKICRTGVTIDLVPYLLDDGRIRIDLDTVVRENIAMVNYGSPVLQLRRQAFQRGKPVVISENRTVAPVFALRQSKTTVSIHDGTTVSFCMFLRKQRQTVEEGVLIKKSYEHVTDRYLTVFLKAEIMDPAGVPLN